jgi:hypothetical protein
MRAYIAEVMRTGQWSEKKAAWIGKKYGCTASNVIAYRKRIIRDLRKAAQESDHESNYAEFLERLRYAIGEALRAKQFMAVKQLMALEASITGLDQPIVIEARVTGEGGKGPAQFDVRHNYDLSDLTTEQLRERARAMREAGHGRTIDASTPGGALQQRTTADDEGG